MTHNSQWRYEIAERVASYYAQIPDVVAVMVGGSTARKHADKFSDIELGVFWNRPPQDSERKAVTRALNADVIYHHPYDVSEAVWSDDFMIGRDTDNTPKSGVLVEIVHHTTAFIEHTLYHVLHKHNADLLGQNLIAGITQGQAFHGDELLETWRNRARDYPDALALAMVKQYAVIDHFWRWEMFLHRDENLMLLYQSFTQIQQRILYMLLGLNREYYFGFKWLEVVCGKLTIAPDNLLGRLREVYQVEPADGARKLIVLVNETYDLLETHMPQINVERLRDIFHYQRPSWDEQPPRTP